MNAKRALQTLCVDLDRRLQDAQRRLDEWELHHEAQMEACVGAHNLARIRSSKDFAIQLLDHPDPKVRITALEMLVSHWRIDRTEPCVSRIEELVSFDPEIDVRAHASAGWGSCFRGTDDSRVGKALAAVVIDGNNPECLRYWAYFGLLQLQFRSPITMAHFPENMDLDYVNDFCRENRRPQPVTDTEQGFLKERGWEGE